MAFYNVLMSFYVSIRFSGMLWHFGHGVSCGAYTAGSDLCCVLTDIVVDNCAICRNHIMDLCKL